MVKIIILIAVTIMSNVTYAYTDFTCMGQCSLGWNSCLDYCSESAIEQRRLKAQAEYYAAVKKEQERPATKRDIDQLKNQIQQNTLIQNNPSSSPSFCTTSCIGRTCQSQCY